MLKTRQFVADRSFRQSLAAHWPEYLIEAALLGIFLIAACTFTVVVQHPSSPVRQVLPSPLARRMVSGLLMGFTAIALIYSPWGRRSGAHFNSAVTLTYCRLQRIPAPDAAFYILCQFAGALRSAENHQRIIERFGRFPHRNKVLGRTTTPQEQAFLDGGGFAG